MKKAILFQGPPRSGKDTAADYLAAKHPHETMRLACKDKLIKDTVQEFDVTMEWFMDDYDSNKELPMKELQGKSKRQALIYTSEEVMKPWHGSDVYGQSVAKAMVDGKIALISDAGFVDEVNAITVNGAGYDQTVLIQISRVGTSFAKDSRKYCPSSSYPMGNYGKPLSAHDPYKSNSEWFPSGVVDVKNMILTNNASLDEFYTELDKIYAMVKGW